MRLSQNPSQEFKNGSYESLKGWRPKLERAYSVRFQSGKITSVNNYIAFFRGYIVFIKGLSTK